MKMAAAEALYETSGSCAPFSILTIGSLDGSEPLFTIEVPCLLSFLATGSTSGEVQGINPLEQELSQQFGAGGTDATEFTQDSSYTPYIPLAYWSFRAMMGLGFLAIAAALAILWVTRRNGMPVHRFWVWVAAATPLLPVFGNSFGWIFTETGRQPWIVYSLMTTHTGVSPSVSGGEVITSMVAYTLVYAVLAVIEVKLFLTYVRRGADPFEKPIPPEDVDDDAPLQFAY